MVFLFIIVVGCVTIVRHVTLLPLRLPVWGLALRRVGRVQLELVVLLLMIVIAIARAGHTAANAVSVPQAAACLGAGPPARRQGAAGTGGVADTDCVTFSV